MSLPIQSPPTPEQIPGYELTGEYREIKYGEEYWTNFDAIGVANILHPSKRWILRKKEPKPTLIAALPPPPQAWLDKHKVKLTGEYRHAVYGDYVAKMRTDRMYADLDINYPWVFDCGISSAKRWILAPL